MRLVEDIPLQATDNGKPMDQDASAVLDRLGCAVRSCERFVVVDKDNMPPKDARRYLGLLRVLKDSINAHFPGPTVDLRIYVNALLYRAEESAMLVNSRQKRKAWNDLCSVLQELYLTFDPEMVASDAMDAGEQFAKSI